jgi:hypothetical protein
MAYWTIGSVTKRSLWYSNVGSILRIVKGLNMNGGGRVAWGRGRGHDGMGLKFERDGTPRTRLLAL